MQPLSRIVIKFPFLFGLLNRRGLLHCTGCVDMIAFSDSGVFRCISGAVKDDEERLLISWSQPKDSIADLMQDLRICNRYLFAYKCFSIGRTQDRIEVSGLRISLNRSTRPRSTPTPPATELAKQGDDDHYPPEP